MLVGLRRGYALVPKSLREAWRSCRELMDIHSCAFTQAAMAAVLRFKVDAIVLTGGMAFSDRLCKAIGDYVGKIAPIVVLPGEEEMAALAAGAFRALRGGEISTYGKGGA